MAALVMQHSFLHNLSTFDKRADLLAIFKLEEFVEGIFIS